MVNQYFKNCKMCGKKFVTFNPRVKKCDECKSEDTITHKSDNQYRAKIESGEIAI